VGSREKINAQSATMGRTLSSFTQLIINEQDALAKFRRALRKQDQRAFDDLFRAARYHVAAAAYASHLLPFETMLLAMLIEEHKRVQHLETLLERLLERMPDEAGPLSRWLPLSLEDAKIADEKGA
jgi:hypothetical protein